MLTNADITIFNKKYNDITRVDDWTKTVIKNVHWFVDNKAQLVSGGTVNKDVFKVRIPSNAIMAKNYVDADDYTTPALQWTLDKGDYVAKGELSDITSPKDLPVRGVFKIISYSDNRIGGLPHWRIGGE